MTTIHEHGDQRLELDEFDTAAIAFGAEKIDWGGDDLSCTCPVSHAYATVMVTVQNNPRWQADWPETIYHVVSDRTGERIYRYLPRKMYEFQEHWAARGH